MRKPRDPAREAQALDAYRALASDAYDLRQAMFVLEQVDKAVMQIATSTAFASDSCHVYILNDEQEGARQHAMHHLGDLARRLLDNFDRIEGMGRAT